MVDVLLSVVVVAVVAVVHAGYAAVTTADAERDGFVPVDAQIIDTPVAPVAPVVHADRLNIELRAAIERWTRPRRSGHAYGTICTTDWARRSLVSRSAWSSRCASAPPH
ncbi:hypothetical protein [Streptomyces avermitilis]|uniref:hypothetical protein n=1 Tax=Streptomyces avermitilis TaxID=33903 RepID=UPI003680274C